MNKNNLTELKSFGTPPKAVIHVCAAVLVLFSGKAKIPKDRSWRACKVRFATFTMFACLFTIVEFVFQTIFFLLYSCLCVAIVANDGCCRQVLTQIGELRQRKHTAKSHQSVTTVLESKPSEYYCKFPAFFVVFFFFEQKQHVD